MLIGYNTNGFAHHRLVDALPILAELGYKSAAITLERAHLDPPDQRGVPGCVELLAPLLESTGLRATIETGARFVLDPWRKHQPTLLSANPVEATQRLEFLKASVDVAAEVMAESVSLWSGVADDEAPVSVLWDRLRERLLELLDYAGARGVRIAFEPEPGMFIDTMARFEELTDRLAHPSLGLTLDVGHVMCLDDGLIERHVKRWRERLWNVHIEDMRRGVHEHLMFGEGEIDFDLVSGALTGIGFAGSIHVELSRHGHMAVEAARKSMAFLRGHLKSEVV